MFAQVRLIVTFLTILPCTFSQTFEDQEMSQFRETYLSGLMTCPPILLQATFQDITIYYYSKLTSPSAVLKVNEVYKLESTSYNPSLRNVFISHGWKKSHDSPISQILGKAILDNHSANLFLIDWSPKSERNYCTALNAVPVIGQGVAKFILELQKKYSIANDLFLFLGHSLGAHVLGVMGETLGGTVGKIIGMDPAGPFVDYSKTNNRLDKGDAIFVEIIHTNGGQFGTNKIIGHSDYFPNGGTIQNGCFDSICSHKRSFEYIAESFYKKGFKSLNCESYTKFKSGLCDNNNTSNMGGYDLDEELGTYYLETNPDSPYSKE